MIRFAMVAMAAIAGFAAVTDAQAQDFYKGKTLTIIVGYSPGGNSTPMHDFSPTISAAISRAILTNWYGNI